MTISILTGDCRELLRAMPDNSVQCVVTSPPYFGLRDYKVAGQIGLETSPAEYIAEMVAVFHEVRRVLRKDGTCWLNLGDSYAGSGRGGYPGGKSGLLGKNTEGQDNSRIARGSQKAAGLHEKARLAGTVGRAWSPAPTGLKQKDLMMMPARVAIALQDSGWYLRSDIIWYKPNPMPESCRDRPTSAHEHVFLLTKSGSYFYDADAIRQPRTQDEDASTFRGGAYVGGNLDNSVGNKRTVIGNKKIKIPGAWDLGDGAHGTIHRAGRTSATYTERGVPPRHAQYDSSDRNTLNDVGRGEGANARNVWTIATHPYAEAHFATFPPALAERCIKAGTKPGDLVLDPFGGAGTTGMVADRLQRNAVLLELNPQYVALAERRIAEDRGALLHAMAAE